jgi:hypothetical protein
MAFSAIIGCSSRPTQPDSAPAAQSAETRSQVGMLTSVPVAQAPVSHSEGTVLAAALIEENRAQAVALTSPVAAQAPAADQEAMTLAKARKLGYRIVDKNGEKLFCHDSVATGSHVNKTTICLTQKQWENVSENSAREMERFQKNTFPCPQGSKGGCGG